MELKDLLSRACVDYVQRCETIKHDYESGCRDCRNHIYDKFYRYNRSDDGSAYDLGWYNTNKTEQVEVVTFI